MLKRLTTFFCLMLVSNICLADMMQVVLKEELSSPMSVITIKDVIDSSQTDISFTRNYGSITVCDDSNSCQFIDQTRFLSALYKAGAPVDQISLRMNQSVKIEQGQKISVDQNLQNKITQILHTQFNIPENDVQIDNASILPALSAPLAAMTIVDVSVENLNQLSKASFKIRMQDEEGNEEFHSLYSTLSINTPVLITSIDLKSGDSLNPDSYLVGRQKLKSLSQALLSATDIQRGNLRVSQDLNKDQILYRSNTRSAEIIKEGSLVTLSFKSPFIAVNTQGKLQDKSEVGTMVQVENLESKKTVMGLLVSKNRVEVASAK